MPKISSERRKVANGHSPIENCVREPSAIGSQMSSPTSSAGAKNGQEIDHGVITYLDIRNKYPVYDTARPSSHTDCSESCRFEESLTSVEMFSKAVHSPLVIPLLFGYDRQAKSVIGKNGTTKNTIVYVTPCGRTISTMAAIDAYLIAVKSFIPITCFSFEAEVSLSRRFVIPRAKVKAARIITNETSPYEIPAFNCFDATSPARFVYINKTINSDTTSSRIDKEGMKKRSEWCACKNVCSGNGESDCLCLSILDEQTSGYSYGLLTGPQRYVVECSDACACSPLCRNRVTTNSIPWRVMLYFYPKKGWGVRGTCDIPKGAFVGMYVGQLLTEVEVGRGDRPDTYFFTLKTLNDDDQPVTKGKNAQSQDTTADPYEKLFSLDANRFGNYTRFFNHSCQPNCFAQVVFREYCGPLVYSMAFFTKKNISAGEEMTWDYNYSVGSVQDRRIDCECGSENCRGRLL